MRCKFENETVDCAAIGRRVYDIRMTKRGRFFFGYYSATTPFLPIPVNSKPAEAGEFSHGTFQPFTA
jgi:hypothetical protein